MVGDSVGPYPGMERVEALLSEACHPKVWGWYSDRLRRVLVFAAAEASVEVGDDPPVAVKVSLAAVLIGLALEGEQDAEGGSLAARALKLVGVSSHDLREAAQAPVNEPEGMTLKVPAGTWRHPLGSFRGWPQALALTDDVRGLLTYAGHLRGRAIGASTPDYLSPDYVLEAVLEDRKGRELVNACGNNTRGRALSTVRAVEVALRLVRVDAVDEASAGMRAPEAVPVTGLEAKPWKIGEHEGVGIVESDSAVEVLPEGWTCPVSDRELYVAARDGVTVWVRRLVGALVWRWDAWTGDGSPGSYDPVAESSGFLTAWEAMVDADRVLAVDPPEIEKVLLALKADREAAGDPDPHWVRQGERQTAADMAAERDKAWAERVARTDGLPGAEAWRGLGIFQSRLVDPTEMVEVYTVMVGDVPCLDFRVVAGGEAMGVDVPLTRCRGLADMILAELDPVDAEIVCGGEAQVDAIAEMYGSEQARIEAARSLRGMVMAAFDAGAVWAVAEQRKEALAAEHKDEADRMVSRHREAAERARGEAWDHHGQRKRLAEEAALVVWGHGLEPHREPHRDNPEPVGEGSESQLTVEGSGDG